MNHESLAQELVRSLRGRRSQVALSRRLQRRSNVLYTWESGRRSPTAAGFFELAERTGVDVAAGIARFLGALPDTLAGRDWKDPRTVATLLAHLREGTTLQTLAARVGTNRVSVGRWLKAEAEPRLPDFLRLVDALSVRLLDFVALFAPPESLPSTQRAWETLEAQRRVAYSLPWSHAVLRVLELADYRRLPRHRDGFIAERLGIEEAEERRCLRALAESKLIARRQQRWVVREVLTVDTRRNPEAGRALKQHWAAVAHERLPTLEPAGEDLFSYNLFTVSEADFERLRELHINYYLELRRIVEASSPGERVALVNVQLLRLDARGPTDTPTPRASRRAVR